MSKQRIEAKVIEGYRWNRLTCNEQEFLKGKYATVLNGNAEAVKANELLEWRVIKDVSVETPKTKAKGKTGDDDQAPKITPAALDLAREWQLEPGSVTATGKGDVVTKGDIQKHIRELAKNYGTTKDVLALSIEYGVDIGGIQGTGKDGAVLKVDVENANAAVKSGDGLVDPESESFGKNMAEVLKQIEAMEADGTLNEESVQTLADEAGLKMEDIVAARDGAESDDDDQGGA